MAVKLRHVKTSAESDLDVVKRGRTSSPAEPSPPPRGPIAYCACCSSPSDASSLTVLAWAAARALDLGVERKGERKEDRIPLNRDFRAHPSATESSTRPRSHSREFLWKERWSSGESKARTPLDEFACRSGPALLASLRLPS